MVVEEVKNLKEVFRISTLTDEGAEYLISAFRILARKPDKKWEEDGTEYELWNEGEFVVLWSHDIGAPDEDLIIYERR